MSKQLESHSKFLSLVLRHKPDTIGLELDSEGWADLGRLIDLAKAHGMPLDLQLVQEIVSTSDKQRFRLSADGSKII